MTDCPKEMLDQIIDYVTKNLNADWVIEISMSRDEVDVSLYTPYGDNEHVDLDRGDSVIEAMCRCSHEGDETCGDTEPKKGGE